MCANKKRFKRSLPRLQPSLTTTRLVRLVSLNLLNTRLMALAQALTRCHSICGLCPTQNWQRFGQMSVNSIQMVNKFPSTNSSSKFPMAQTCSKFGHVTYLMTLASSDSPRAAKYSTSPISSLSHLWSQATSVILVSSLSTNLCNKTSV